MDWHAAGLRRLDGLIWALVAFVAVFVLIASAARGFTVEFRSFAAPGLTCVLLVAGARFYRDRRGEPRLASALESTAQVMAFAAVAAPLSYVAASAGLPLQDAMFDSLDRALGLDWTGLLAFMRHWPEFASFLNVMYLSLTVQMTAVVLLLGFTGRLPWLRVYMLAFVFATLTTIALSTVLPAEGVWLHYGLKGDAAMLPASHTSWPVFLGLRDGSYRLIVAIGAEGIITFPSLHAALAVILMAALWPVPLARWLSVGINTLMLAATPIDGSHYFVDVLAGVAIAVASLAAARALVARWTEPFRSATSGELVVVSPKTIAPAP